MTMTVIAITPYMYVNCHRQCQTAPAMRMMKSLHFDTVDLKILLSRLQYHFGIHDIHGSPGLV